MGVQGPEQPWPHPRGGVRTPGPDPTAAHHVFWRGESLSPQYNRPHGAMKWYLPSVTPTPPLKSAEWPSRQRACPQAKEGGQGQCRAGWGCGMSGHLHCQSPGLPAPPLGPWPRMTPCRPPRPLGAATLGSWPVGVEPSLGSQRKAHPPRPGPGRDQAFLTGPHTRFTTARSQPQTHRSSHACSHICACTLSPRGSPSLPTACGPGSDLPGWALLCDPRLSGAGGSRDSPQCGPQPGSQVRSAPAQPLPQIQGPLGPPSPLPGQGQRVHGGGSAGGSHRPGPARWLLHPGEWEGAPGRRLEPRGCWFQRRLPLSLGSQAPPAGLGLGFLLGRAGPAPREAGGAQPQAVPSPAALPTPH